MATATLMLDDKHQDTTVRALLDAVHETATFAAEAADRVRIDAEFDRFEMNGLSIWMRKLRDLTAVLDEMAPEGWD